MKLDNETKRELQETLNQAIQNIGWYEYKGGPQFSDSLRDDCRSIIECKALLLGVTLDEDEIKNIASYLDDKGLFDHERIAKMKKAEFSTFIKRMKNPDKLVVAVREARDQIAKLNLELCRIECRMLGLSDDD
jgi:hypothetical protein